MNRFHVTYEVVTPESAADGDAAERGYARPHGWQWPGETMTAEDVEACAMSLREAAGMVGMVEDCGAWFCEVDGRPNYRTGAETRYSLHPPANLTDASYRRLRRVLGIKGA